MTLLTYSGEPLPSDAITSMIPIILINHAEMLTMVVRLNLVNIVEHAVIRYLEAVKRSSETQMFMFNQTLREIAPALVLKAA